MPDAGRKRETEDACVRVARLCDGGEGGGGGGVGRGTSGTTRERVHAIERERERERERGRERKRQGEGEVTQTSGCIKCAYRLRRRKSRGASR